MRWVGNVARVGRMQTGVEWQNVGIVQIFGDIWDDGVKERV
jgi:hypothetical protein